MRNPEVDELLQFIDNHPGNATISKENILDPPSRVFFTLKSMYQAFKKSNEYQLMQHKVYKVIIKQQSKNNHEVTKVNAKTLCQTHKFQETDVTALIKIYGLLPFQKQIEILEEILECIGKLNTFEESCKCYKILILNTKKNVNFEKLYPIIEVKMFKNILDMKLADKDFTTVSKLILSLPRINEQVMFFIGDLFEKVDSLDEFKMIQLIFEEKVTKNPTPYQLQAIFKVGTPKNLLRIKKIMEKDNSFVPLLEQQAKNKLKKPYTILNEKSLAVIEFISYCISLKCEIWKQILNWQTILCGECKVVLLQKVTQHLNDILKNQKKRLAKSFLEVLAHMTKRDSQSLITKFLFQSILNINDKKLLSNKVIRRFLALKILTIQNFSNWEVLFNTSFCHIETILQMFSFEKDVVGFFKKIIENAQTYDMLKKYLNQLLEKQPTNFRDFFVKVDQTAKGQIFNTTNFLFLNFFWKIPFSMAYSVVRQLANKPPSLFLIVSLAKFLEKLQKPQQMLIMKTQIIKTINTILLNPHELNQDFKKHLVDFCGKYLTAQDQQAVFKDVSPEFLKTIKIVDAMMKRR